MTIIIIIFFIAIISLFGMVVFRAWEINKVDSQDHLPKRKMIPEIYFRHIEKIMLYLTKYVIQSMVFITVKYWFIFLTKTKKWADKNWPRVYKFFKKDKDDMVDNNNSFFKKAVLESKIKIRNIKEKVRREHGN